MITRLLFAGTALFTVFSATHLWGQPDQPRQRPIPPLFQMFDTDGDGVLSSNEIRNAAEVLRNLDTNDDAEVTPDEFAGGMRAQMQRGRAGAEPPRREEGQARPPRRPENRAGQPGQPPAERAGPPRGPGAAERPGDPLRGPGFAMGPNFIDRLFQFDKDNDGKLSREELQGAVEQARRDREDRAEAGPPNRERIRSEGAQGRRGPGGRGAGEGPRDQEFRRDRQGDGGDGQDD